jgi:tetratricopeptide (TPR) repeat protein
LKSNHKLTALEAITDSKEINSKIYISSGKYIQIFKFNSIPDSDSDSMDSPRSPFSKAKKFHFDSTIAKNGPTTLKVHKNEKIVKKFYKLSSNVFASVSYDSESMEDILSVWKISTGQKVVRLFKKKFQTPIKDFIIGKNGELICCFGKEIQVYHTFLDEVELKKFLVYFTKKNDLHRCSTIADLLSTMYLQEERFEEIEKLENFYSFILFENVSIAKEKLKKFQEAAVFLLKSAHGYFEIHKYQYSLRLIEKALKFNSDLFNDVECLKLQIECLLKLEDFQKVCKVKLNLGSVYMKQKEYIMSYIEYESIQHRNEENLEPLIVIYKELKDEMHFMHTSIELGRIYLEKKEYKKIETLLEPIEKKNSSQLFLLAKAKELLNSLEEASRCIIKLVSQSS